MTTRACPNCEIEYDNTVYNCPKCNYGLASQPKPAKRAPRFMGDSSGESRDEELCRTFRCSNCRSFGGSVKRIAATGAGFAGFFDFQTSEFIVVSCSFCGLVQMYDPEIVDVSSSGWPNVDFLFDQEPTN